MNPTIKAQLEAAVAQAVARALDEPKREPAEGGGYAALSIAEFCREYRISRALLYIQWKRGRGPPRFRIGNRVLISRKAADAWIAEREAAELAAMAAEARS